MHLGCDCLYDSFYTYTMITVWFMIEANLLKWQSAMILYMILFTHAMIITWFSIEREEEWSHSSSAAFTTSIAGRSDATVNLSISIEQALVNHANLSNPTHTALKTICRAEQPQLPELVIVKPPQTVATQLLPCVKRCQKVEGRAWSVTGKAWDTHEREGSLQW